MRGEKPVVLREPYRLAKPFKMFPPRIDRDWPTILAKIPFGGGLRVPVSPGTATLALGHLAGRGKIRRHEFVVNRTRAGGCVVYHLQVFLGESFRIEPRPRQPQRPKDYWDKVLRRVMSGKTVTVNAPYMVVYMALYRRSHTKFARSIRFEKVVKNGKECVVLRRK